MLQFSLEKEYRNLVSCIWAIIKQIDLYLFLVSLSNPNSSCMQYLYICVCTCPFFLVKAAFFLFYIYKVF